MHQNPAFYWRFRAFSTVHPPRMHRFAVLHGTLSPVCARRGLFSAEAAVAARTENRTMRHKDSAAKMAALPVRRGSYQQPSATRQKKREAKKRKSPCTPFREKAKRKESDRRVLSRNRLSRADARATARSAIAPYPGLDRLVAAALDADLDTAVGAFAGSADDRRIWASIAWRVGVEAFHFALMDKLAEDAVDGQARRPSAAFQAFLNERFPRGGAA